MSEHNDLPADPNHEDLFEREMRGYSRRRVDEFVAKTRSQVRDLEDRLSQTLEERERMSRDLVTAREAAADKPAHEEISERIGQILKLAEDESKAQRGRADEENAKLREEARLDTIKLRGEVKDETDKTRAEAHEQAERMLSAAQEQAESTVASATSEAAKARASAMSEAERAVSEATRQAESALSTAKAQAKQQLDEATARASAIHDGAERRLNLLTSRHTEAIRRLTEIRDVVTTLVAGEAARGSLEEEVARAVAAAQAEANGGPGSGGPGKGGSGNGGPPVAVGAGRPAQADIRRGASGTVPAPAAVIPPAAQGGPALQRTPGGAATRVSASAETSGPGQPAEPAAVGQQAAGQQPVGQQPVGQQPVGQQAARPAASPSGKPGLSAHEGARHAAPGGRSADSDEASGSIRAVRE